ncbi:protein RKD3-like [Panicum miliaceum]|uniref:Protein RKD3-like n=1 Tax=Panicum miliaceum TaxID=4540 RepID=A0A3L6RT05_PANMI|nr:protein RKD3-like [Panicum miliaceum]
MEELRFYEEGACFQFQGLKLHEDEGYFQFQDFSADYLLGEETHFGAISCPESSFCQEELGCLSEIDFASFWALVEEEDARRKSEEDPRSGPGKKQELTFELVSRHFSMPIKQAARELNVGLTVLKKRCRELGIPRWPHRKVKSLQTLIDNVQELAAQEDGHQTRSLVENLQRTKKLIEERPEVMLYVEI